MGNQNQEALAEFQESDVNWEQGHVNGDLKSMGHQRSHEGRLSREEMVQKGEKSPKS